MCKTQRQSAVIHLSMLAHKLFSSKEEKKVAEKSTKPPKKAPHDGKKVSDHKKKDKGPYRGPNRLPTKQLENYHSNNKSF